jgi:DNA gyrase/topoisomerase IV subunit B
MSPALYKIIDELIVNAYDATIRDNTVDSISAEIKPESFSIYNNGSGIDITIHKDHKVYIPQLIFGELLTSANYDENEERITGGTFGIGSKLTNIFSKKFIVEVWDKHRKLYYYQEFESNLSKINKPIITKQTDKILGGVKITTFPDFERFKMTEFSPDIISLLTRRMLDLCGLVRKNIIIKVNDIEYITGFEKTNMGAILQKNLSNTKFTFYPDPYTDQNLFYRSDNATLARLGVPAHTISTSKMDSEPNYHKASDEIGTLNLENMTAIIRAIALSAKGIVDGKDTPTRVDTSTLK